VITHETREIWNRSTSVSDLYAAAFFADISEHILRNFGYDLSVFDEPATDALVGDVADWIAREDKTIGRASCLAFARYVCENGGAEAFGLTEAAISEWV
jgi:hypothetical protein